MTPEFLFDFGSPNAYLAWKVLPQIEARTGVRFAYTPILLGGLFKATGNQPPMLAFKDVPNKQRYEMRELERFVARHRLTAYRFNPHFPVNTLAIMRGATAARRLGCFEAYVAAVFAAMWEDGVKMDNPAEIVRVLTAAGLPAAALMEASQAPEVKAELADATAKAAARGAFGAPSFFVGEELFFGKDRLPDVEAEIVKQKG